MDPRTERAIQAMRSMYPEALADKAWDNVGLLLANTADAAKGDDRIMLTNDLTSRVADEAIARGVHLVISYHPIIFRGLKSITLDDPQQTSLIRLAQNNIAVYSPHTALDAAPAGINDWLADAVTEAAADLSAIARVTHALKPLSGEQLKAIDPASGYRIPNNIWGYRVDESGNSIVGYGRHVSLKEPVAVSKLIRGIFENMGLLDATATAPCTLKHALVVRPRTSTGAPSDGPVSSVALCAGSGADILRGASADLLLTGEMSHHDALAASARGKWVVCLLHSNSERLFLKERLQPNLEFTLSKRGFRTEVVVSEADCDPFEVWDLSEAA